MNPNHGGLALKNVVPVLNEEFVLDKSIRELANYLKLEMPTRGNTNRLLPHVWLRLSPPLLIDVWTLFADEFQCQLCADHLGQVLGNGLSSLFICGFHHHTYHGFRAGGAEQDPAGVAQRTSQISVRAIFTIPAVLRELLVGLATLSSVWTADYLLGSMPLQAR